MARPAGSTPLPIRNTASQTELLSLFCYSLCPLTPSPTQKPYPVTFHHSFDKYLLTFSWLQACLFKNWRPWTAGAKQRPVRDKLVLVFGAWRICYFSYWPCKLRLNLVKLWKFLASPKGGGDDPRQLGGITTLIPREENSSSLCLLVVVRSKIVILINFRVHSAGLQPSKHGGKLNT